MPLDLEAIKDRLAAATPKPWDWWAGDVAVIVFRPNGCYRDNIGYVYSRDPNGDEPRPWRANADLIAHAPTDLVALIEEVEQLRAAVQATYTAHDPAAFFAAERALRSLVSDTLDEQATQQAFEALPPKEGE